MRPDIDVTGEDAAALRIAGIGERANDLRPAGRKLRDLLTRGNAKQFTTHGAYFSESWPPLAESTALRKGSSEIGVRTGALKAALMGGRGRRTSVTQKQVTVGVNKSIFYARFFAGGTKSGQPARPLFGATDGQIRTATFILQRWVTQGHA